MHPGTNTGMSNSFTDLMTSLAVIFILLLCASLNNAQQEGQTTVNSVLAEMQRELKEFVSGGIEVKSDPKDPLGLLILVPEDLLAFPLDRADISPNGELFLRAFIPNCPKLSVHRGSPKKSIRLLLRDIPTHPVQPSITGILVKKGRCPSSGRV